MASLGNFDADKVDPNPKNEVLPAGKYPAVITKSSMVKTKAGDGRYLELVFEVIDGPHSGSYLWARLNMENRNPMTVKKAHAELSHICRATGVMVPKDSNDLHNIPVELEVAVEARSDNGQPSNVIKSYAKCEAPEKPYGDIPV